MKAIKLPCFPPRQISYCIYEYDTFNRRMELESPSLHCTLLHSSRAALAVSKQSLVQSCVLCARITGNVCLHWTPPTLHRLLFVLTEHIYTKTQRHKDTKTQRHKHTKTQTHKHTKTKSVYIELHRLFIGCFFVLTEHFNARRVCWYSLQMWWQSFEMKFWERF